MKKINRGELYKCGFNECKYSTDIFNGYAVLSPPLKYSIEYYDPELQGVIEVEIYGAEIKRRKKNSWCFYDTESKSYTINSNLDYILNLYQDYITYSFETGFVYILKKDGENCYKIGKTKNIKARMDFFKLKIPFNFEVICLYRSTNYAQLEKKIQKFFKIENKHITGEWFLLSDEDLKRIDLFYIRQQEYINELPFIVNKPFSFYSF